MRERELLAHLCHDYKQRWLTREQFVEAVFAIVSAWDCFSGSQLYAQIEATVREHFCQWWDDCDEECSYRRDRRQLPPWKDGWAPLEWPPDQRAIAQPDGNPRDGRARDARTVVTGTLRARVFARDGHKCKICGAGPPLEIDHIVPVSKGGSGAPANLQSLCAPCNRRKGASIEPTEQREGHVTEVGR